MATSVTVMGVSVSVSQHVIKVTGDDPHHQCLSSVQDGIDSIHKFKMEE